MCLNHSIILYYDYTPISVGNGVSPIALLPLDAESLDAATISEARKIGGYAAKMGWKC